MDSRCAAGCHAQKLATRLREESINIEVDVTGRKADKQLKTAVKKKIPYIVFVGTDELKSEVYPTKNVESSQEEKLSFERIVTTVRDHRRKTRVDEDEEFDLI